MMAAPVLGFGIFGVAVTVLYALGMMPQQAGAAVMAVALMITLWRPRALKPQREGWEVVTAAAAAALLCLLPKWIGGPQFWVFQGNDMDQFNYVAYGSAMRFHSYADLLALTPATAMDNDYLLGAQKMLRSRPTVCVVFAALAAVFGRTSAESAYAFQALMQCFMVFAAAFTLRNCFSARLRPALGLSVALTLGFFLQYVFDISAWSELACLPLVLVGCTVLIVACARSQPVPVFGLVLALALCLSSILYIYPEALMEFGLPCAALLIPTVFSAGEWRRLRPVLGGVVLALVLCLPFASETVALLARMGGVAAFQRLDWWTYFQRYLFGRDLDYFAALSAGDTPFTLLYALISLPIDFVSGVLGVYFILPPAGTAVLWGAVWKVAVAVGCAFLLFAAVRLMMEEWRKDRQSRASRFYVVAVLSLMLPVALALGGRYWPAGKALTMASPLLFIMVAVPVLSGGGRWGRAAAAAFVLLHLGFGLYRPLAAANPSGIHYAWPYPAVPDPTFKTAFSWDLTRWEIPLRGCRHISLDLPHPQQDRYVQMVLSEAGLPWTSQRPLNSYYGTGLTLGLQVQPDFSDCLVTSRLEHVQPGQTLIWLGQGGAVWDFYQGILTSLDLVAVPNGVFSTTGLHAAEVYQGQPLRWTDGRARIALVNNPAYPLRQIELALWAVRQPHSTLRVSVNGRTLFDDRLADGDIQMTLRVPDDLPPSADLVLESNSFNPAGDPRTLGVALRRLVLVR